MNSGSFTRVRPERVNGILMTTRDLGHPRF